MVSVDVPQNQSARYPVPVLLPLKPALRVGHATGPCAPPGAEAHRPRGAHGSVPGHPVGVRWL